MKYISVIIFIIVVLAVLIKEGVSIQRAELKTEKQINLSDSIQRHRCTNIAQRMK